MEMIYMALLFVAPGMIVRELTGYFIKEKRTKGTVYTFLFNIVLDSFIVSAVVLFLIAVQSGINSISGLISHLNILINLFRYVVFMAAMAVIWCFIRNKCINKAALFLKNAALKAENRPTHTTHTTVWDDLMADESFAETWKVISVYRDDTHITSGMLERVVTTNAEEFELMLDRVTETMEMMKAHPEIFKIDYDYLNASTGLRVVVYNQEYIEEHWDYEL